MMYAYFQKLHIDVKHSAHSVIPTSHSRQAARPARFKRITLGLALLGSLLVSACNNHGSLSDEVQGLTLKTLTGYELVLADATGPLLVNFWATDCGVCLREMPELVALYNVNKPAGFELVAIAMPYDPPNRVLEMAEQEQWPFPVALDISGEALNAFATVKGTPTSYLLDKDGRLVKRYVGAIPFDDLQSQLNSLLGLG